MILTYVTLRLSVCSWNLQNPSDYALQFSNSKNATQDTEEKHQGFVTERVSDPYSIVEHLFNFSKLRTSDFFDFENCSWSNL